MKTGSIILFAAVMGVSPAWAEEERRELGPHVHGHGTLNIAIEKSRVTMELEVPGMDIVGFEHAPSTKEQKAAVEKATATLSEPLKLFKVPDGAGCKVADAKVAIEAEHDHDDDRGDKASAKDEHAKGEHAKDTHGDHDHDGHEGHEGHNQFHVTYALDCTKPESLSAIAFDYFKSFAGANALSVNVVTAKAQNTYEVTRDKPALELGGMM